MSLWAAKTEAAPVADAHLHLGLLALFHETDEAPEHEAHAEQRRHSYVAQDVEEVARSDRTAVLRTQRVVKFVPV